MRLARNELMCNSSPLRLISIPLFNLRREDSRARPNNDNYSVF